MFTTTTTTAARRALLQRRLPRYATSSSSPQAHRSLATTNNTTTTSATCPKCGAPLPTRLPVCRECWHMADIPRDTSPHDILGIPYDSSSPFKLDLKDLRRKFLAAQTVCHPDVWANKGERLHAEQLSSRINEAYNTLRLPSARAQYLLENRGLGIVEEEQLEDVEALSEVMEAMEEIEHSHDDRVLEHIRNTNQERIEVTVQDLERAFAEAQHQEAKALLVRLIYWERIERAVRSKLAD